MASTTTHKASYRATTPVLACVKPYSNSNSTNNWIYLLPIRMDEDAVNVDGNFLGLVDVETALANNNPHLSHRFRAVESSIVDEMLTITKVHK